LGEDDDRVICYAERSFLGCRYFNCQCATGKGPSFLVTRGSNTGGLFGCYAELDTGPMEIYSHGFFITPGTLTSATANSFFTGALTNQDWKGINSKCNSAGITSQVQIAGANALYSFCSDWDGYAMQTVPSPIYLGWVGTHWAYSDIFLAEAISTAKAPEGPGFRWFPRAFMVGLMIMLVASVCYVATWQFIYHQVTPDFLEKYTAHTVEQARESGATAEEIARTTKEMGEFAEMYKNPLVNIAFTFLEPLPVGLVFTLVSAGILSRKRRSAGAVAGAS
jgi:hypothetical protein